MKDVRSCHGRGADSVTQIQAHPDVQIRMAGYEHLQQNSEVRSQESEELRHSDALQRELDGSTFLHSAV
jgi:hypothetical protein